ncbi:MAG: hypothetical protein WCI72_05695 [archaeon]
MKLPTQNKDRQTDWHGNCRMQGAKDACERIGYFPPIKHFLPYTRGYLAIKAAPLSDFIYGFVCLVSHRGDEISEHIFRQPYQQKEKASDLELKH